MSAAFVFRTAALLFEKAPDESNQLIKQAILSTATVLPTLQKIFTWGKLDPTKALDFMDSILNKKQVNIKFNDNTKQSESWFILNPFYWM